MMTKEDTMSKEVENKEPSNAAKSVIKDMIARNEKAIEELANKKRQLLNPEERSSVPGSYLFNPPPSAIPAVDFEIGVYNPEKEDTVIKEKEEKEPATRSCMIETPDIKTPPDVRSAFAAYEAYIEDLKKKLIESLEKKEAGDTGDMVIPASCVDELKQIIARFNKELNEWYLKTGCTATFGWSYNTNKTLELLGVDYLVYRHTAPTEETISQLLKKHAPK
jgi:hypothetical protein